VPSSGLDKFSTGRGTGVEKKEQMSAARIIVNDNPTSNQPLIAHLLLPAKNEIENGSDERNEDDHNGPGQLTAAIDKRACKAIDQCPNPEYRRNQHKRQQYGLKQTKRENKNRCSYHK
jgi:hypothetical protein